MRAKQLLYLGKAARKAQRQSLYDLALSYYMQALDVEPRWEWLKGKVEVLHILGRRDEELDTLQDMDRLSTMPPLEAAVLWSEYYESVGDYASAQDRIERALAMYHRESNQHGEVHCLSRLGAVAARQGKFDQSDVYYTTVIETLKGSSHQSDEDVLALIRAYNGRGVALGQQSRYAASHTALEEANRLSRQHSFRREEADSINHLGWLAFYQGDFNSALSRHQRALTIRREIGDRVGEGASYYNLGIIYLEAGDYGKAQDHLLRAEPIHHISGNRWYEVKISNALGVYCLMTGDAVQTRGFLRQSQLLASKIGDRAAEADALCNLGLCYSGVFVASGDLAEAERALQDSLAIAQEKGDQGLSAMCWSYLGLAQLQAGRSDGAIQNALQALHIRRDLELHKMTSIDYATLARAHLIGNNLTQARENTQHALRILEEYGQEGPEFPQRDYYMCYQVLTALGDEPYLALDALKKAFLSVSNKAEKITDPNVRQAFLEKVWINRQIVEDYDSSPLATKRRFS
jgi:tetratricopeptide (TPR) repeat protein